MCCCVVDERKSHRTSGGCHHDSVELSFTKTYSVLFRLERQGLIYSHNSDTWLAFSFLLAMSSSEQVKL